MDSLFSGWVTKNNNAGVANGVGNGGVALTAGTIPYASAGTTLADSPLTRVDASTVSASQYVGTGYIALGATSGAPDVFLKRGGANNPRFENGTTAQTVDVFKTFTDSSNFEKFGLDTSSGNFDLFATKLGTGSARNLRITGTGILGIIFNVQNAGTWQITTASFQPQTDATMTLGDATHRVKYGFFGGSTETTSNPVMTWEQTWNSGGVTFTGLKLNITNSASAAASKLMSLQVAGTELFGVKATGETSIGSKLQFSGTSGSFPMIKQFGVQAQFRLADDSDSTDIAIRKIVNYNNIASVSGGIPVEYATVDLTAQSAAITATTLYTPTASAMFRISFVIRVTTAASTSSILGGTTGVVLTFTEPDGSVAQTFVIAMDDQTGAVIVPANGNAANTTQAMGQGTAVIYAKTGVAIQYAIGYTSVGVTAMQYSVHAKCEQL